MAGFVITAMEGSLDAQPGETFNYTNSGYFILGHLIQKISGQSYESFIQDNFFTPLQMKETTLEKGAENPNTAAGFRRRPPISCDGSSRCTAARCCLPRR